MSNRVVKVVAAVAIVCTMVIGCSAVEKPIEGMKESESLEYLTDGVTLGTWKSNMISIVYDIFNPSQETDVSRGLRKLKPVMTKECYEQLCKDVYYAGGSEKYTIKNLSVQYANEENSIDNTRKLCAKFQIYLRGDVTKSDLVVWEVSFNSDGLLFKYNIGRGSSR